MGLLAKVTPSVSNADTLLYKVPAGRQAIVNINIINRLKVSTEVAVAIMKAFDLSVNSIALTLPGDNFTAIPTIAFEGDCTSQATAVVNSMVLQKIEVDNPGSAYTVGDVLTLTITGAVGSTASATVASTSVTGGITSVTITNAPVFTTLGSVSTVVTGGTGTEATFKGATYGVNAITLTSKGNGYATTPTINFVGNGAGGAISAQMTQIVEIDDYIELGVILTSIGTPTYILNDTGISLGAGDCLFIKSSLANSINAHVWGIEKLA